MDNVKAVQKIIAYLKEQNQETVYRLCANLMIDMRRWDHFDSLPEQEAMSLLRRTNLNSLQLTNFIMSDDDKQEPLTLGLFQ